MCRSCFPASTSTTGMAQMLAQPGQHVPCHLLSLRLAAAHLEQQACLPREFPGRPAAPSLAVPCCFLLRRGTGVRAVHVHMPAATQQYTQQASDKLNSVLAQLACRKMHPVMCETRALQAWLTSVLCCTLAQTTAAECACPASMQHARSLMNIEPVPVFFCRGSAMQQGPSGTYCGDISAASLHADCMAASSAAGMLHCSPG
jgi:hypothetical protein